MAIGQQFLKVTKTTNVVSVTGGAGNTTIDIDVQIFGCPVKLLHHLL